MFERLPDGPALPIVGKINEELNKGCPDLSRVNYWESSFFAVFGSFNVY